MSPKVKLTKNQMLVFASLQASKKPKTAYDLLDELRDRGIKAPAQIYRALTHLVESHLIHRIDSINSYLPCKDPTNEHSNVTCFAICDNCKYVAELSETSISKHINLVISQTGFTSNFATIEVHGTCSVCKV